MSDRGSIGRRLPPAPAPHEPTLAERYTAALHGMQSGVKMRQELEERDLIPDDKRETGPKHLRAGVNSAMADHGALVKLLIEKGLLTGDEYRAAIVEMMEAERDRYAQELTARMGVRVTLG